MSWGFHNRLCMEELGNNKEGVTIYELHEPLEYECMNGDLVIVPKDFQTDLASVPRIPVLFDVLGGRANDESVIHDYLYRTDAVPGVEKERADHIFREAMISRDQAWWIYQFMYKGVKWFGNKFYHRYKVMDKLIMLSALMLTGCLPKPWDFS